MSSATDTSRFLQLLDDGVIFTFQTFDDSNRKDRRSARVLHGNLEEHCAALTALNDSEAGVFVMVNEGDGVVKEHALTCRTRANVIRVRALFVDLDGAPLAPVLNCSDRPDWIVQSSSRRWHAYWRVGDCRLDQFSGVQSALAERFGGDPSVKDLPRVMRLPGFWHRKGEPYQSKLYVPSDYDAIGDLAHE